MRIKFFLFGFTTGVMAMGVAIIAIGFMMSFMGAF